MAREDMLLAIGVGETKEKDYPEFDIPEGFDVADLEEGDEQEVVAKVKLKDGKLCLVSVNGIDLSKKEDPEESDEEEAEDEDGADYVSESEMGSSDPSANNYGSSLASRASAAGLM